MRVQGSESETSPASREGRSRTIGIVGIVALVLLPARLRTARAPAAGARYCSIAVSSIAVAVFFASVAASEVPSTRAETIAPSYNISS